MLNIWTLPDASDGNGPRFKSAREALSILGKLLYHLIFFFLCVDLSLSEQLEHLSAAAHLTLALFKLATGKTFIPTNLYLDVMHMIKNIFFCVAKAKADDPDGSFWIILLRTDCLEELFGILHTMVGSDSNLDMLSLVSCLSGCAEVSNILAKYLHWDRAPRWLNFHATQNSFLIILTILNRRLGGVMYMLKMSHYRLHGDGELVWLKRSVHSWFLF